MVTKSKPTKTSTNGEGMDALEAFAIEGAIGVTVGNAVGLLDIVSEESAVEEEDIVKEAVLVDVLVEVLLNVPLIELIEFLRDYLNALFSRYAILMFVKLKS